MMAGFAAASGEVRGWRIDTEPHARTWDSGTGAEKVGGRWNTVGVKAVYASADPSTAILEIAVHKGFAVLDTKPHVLTCFRVKNPADLFVVQPADIPNPAWLWPGTPGVGQQAFGDELLQRHRFVLLPSAVSPHSWNLLVSPGLAPGAYELEFQERLALDTRLNPAPGTRP